MKLNLRIVANTISHAADTVDAHLASGVEAFVVYMDRHPGFAAVLNPGSILRRISYRHTDEVMTRNRR